MTKREALEKFLSLKDDKQVALWNDYCDASHNWDKQLSINDEEFFDEHYGDRGLGVMDVLSDVHFGNYTYTDKFVTITEDNILVSAKDMMTVIDFMGIRDEFSKWLIHKGV